MEGNRLLNKAKLAMLATQCYGVDR